MAEAAAAARSAKGGAASASELEREVAHLRINLNNAAGDGGKEQLLDLNGVKEQLKDILQVVNFFKDEQERRESLLR